MKIYISAAMTSILKGTNTEYYLRIQEKINKLSLDLQALSFDVFNPFEIPQNNIDKFWDSSPREIYQKEFQEVLTSDILLAFLDHTSHGVGVELGWADVMRKIIILIHQKDIKISALVLGLPTVRKVIKTDNVMEIPDISILNGILQTA